jgi:hypothetical protein
MFVETGQCSEDMQVLAFLPGRRVLSYTPTINTGTNAEHENLLNVCINWIVSEMKSLRAFYR